MLLGGLATVAAFLLRARLFPGHAPPPCRRGVTNDVLVGARPRRAATSAATHARCCARRRLISDGDARSNCEAPSLSLAQVASSCLLLLGAATACGPRRSGNARLRVHARHGALGRLQRLRAQPGDPRRPDAAAAGRRDDRARLPRPFHYAARRGGRCARRPRAAQPVPADARRRWREDRRCTRPTASSATAPTARATGR